MIDEKYSSKWKIPNFSEANELKINDSDIKAADFIIDKKIRKENLFTYFKIVEIKSEQIYLAKILKRNKNKDQTQSYEQLERNLLNDVIFLRQLGYPTIIKYIGYSSTGVDQKHQPTLVTEYAPNGLLSDIIIKKSKDPNQETEWDDTKRLINIYGIAATISYLHTYNILHRNLNCYNIYENKDFYPLVSNFENSVVMGKEQETYPEPGKTIGIAMFVAPEILTKQEYSKSSDIYAFGMIVYAIMSNSIPFEDIQKKEDIIQKIKDGERPKIDDKIPDVYRELIEECWSQDPTKRPTIANILERLKEDARFWETVDYNKYEACIKNLPLLNSEMKEEEEGTKIKIMKKLEKIKLISKENFYDVFEVRIKNTQKKLIAKMFHVYFDEYQSDKQERIIKIMKQILAINHPSILKCIDFSEIGFDHENRPTLVTEYNKNITLEDIITKKAPTDIIDRFDATKKLINIYGIAKAMSYLNSQNIFHLELTPSNIIIEDSNLYPKIKDFLLEGNFDSLKTIAKIHNISPYCSPETYKGNKFKESDEVFSFGLIIYAIMSNEIPFKNIKLKDIKNIVDNNFRPIISTEIDPNYRELIEKCWSNDPTQRPTFSEIFEKIEKDKKFITEGVNHDEFQHFIQNKGNEKEYKETPTENREDKSDNYNDDNDPHKKSESGNGCHKIDDDNDSHKKSEPGGGGHKSDDDNDPYKKPESGGGGNGSDDDNDPHKKPESGGGGNGSDDDDDDPHKKPEPEGGGHGSDDDDDGNSSSSSDNENEEEEENDSNKIDLEDYKIRDKIGFGGASDVYRAIKIEDDSIYAYKKFHRNVVENPQCEIKYHSRASHPSIVKFFGHGGHIKKNSFVILEYLKNGNIEKIFKKIQKDKNFSDWNYTIRLINLYGIASAMEYLHSKKILHRDLNISNVLVDESLKPKLNDFDRSISFSEISKQKDSVGTPSYMAPEIFDNQIYSEKSDVYAYGILAYEIMTNKRVMEGLSEVQVMYKLSEKYRPSFNKTIPQCYKDLIESCWDIDPDKRPTFANIVEKLKESSFTEASFNESDERIDVSAYKKYIDEIDNEKKKKSDFNEINQ